jgi:alpha-1,3-rhamnosyl/mannosyltransferase
VRVVVNRLPLLGPRTGVGHYTAELLRGLAAQVGGDEIACFPGGWLWQARRLWTAVRPPRSETSTSSPGTGPTAARPPSPLSRFRRAVVAGLSAVKCRLNERNFRKVLARRGCDLYHEPNHVPLPCACRTLVTIHDLSALLHPQLHPPARAAHFARHFPRALSQASHFLTDTEFIRREVIEKLNVAPERVTHVPIGIRRGLGPLPAEEVARALGSLGLPSRYLLYLGTIEPRKNLALLIRAYLALPEALRRDCPLLLVGGWGWGVADVAALLQEQGPRGVLHLGYVPERYLSALYTGAVALVYPSLYEGFGLPPLEMMACGGAVLASTAGALAEVVGARAHLIDPHDVDGWRDALARVLSDDDWRQSLRRGTRELAAPFTWERCAVETLQVYRALTGERAAA